MRRALLPLILSVVLTGCVANSPEQGYIVGTLMGAAIGGPAGPAVGAATGYVVGKLLEGPLDEMRQRRERQVLAEQLYGPGATPPPAPLPETGGSSGDKQERLIEGHYETVKRMRFVETEGTRERVWSDERVVDGRVVAGHFEDQGVPQGEWQPVEETIWVPSHHE